MRSEYAQASERYRLAVMDSIKIFGVYSPMLMLLGNVFIAGALVLGGYAVLGGTMQIGTLLALVIYANRVFEPVMQLSEFYTCSSLRCLRWRSCRRSWLRSRRLLSRIIRMSAL